MNARPLVAGLLAALALVGAPIAARAAPCTIETPSSSKLEASLAAVEVMLGAEADVDKVVTWATSELTAPPVALPTLAGTSEVAKAMFAGFTTAGTWPERFEAAAVKLDELRDKRRRDAATVPPPANAAALRASAQDLDTAANYLRWSMLPSGPTMIIDQPVAISVVLVNPPTTRLRISFDRLDGRSHAELEWDPAIDEGLVRMVNLDAGRWSVSPMIEPTTVQEGAGSIVIASPFTGLRVDGDALVLTALHTALVADTDEANASAKQVAMTGWPRPTLSLRCSTAGTTIDDVPFTRPQAAADLSPRGLGAAPEIVTDTLSILAQIAIERARAGAMDLVKDKFVAPLCGKDGDDEAGAITLDELHLAGTTRAFPRTCELIQRLRLDDVLSSGESLLLALRDDLRKTIAPAAVGRLAAGQRYEPVLQAVLEVANRGIDAGSFDGLGADLLLSVLSRADLVLGDSVAVTITLPPAVTTALVGVVGTEGLLSKLVAIAPANALCNAGETPVDCATRLVKDPTVGSLIDLAQRLVVLKVSDAELNAIVQELREPLVAAITSTALQSLRALAGRYGHVRLYLPGNTALKDVLKTALAVELQSRTAEQIAALCGVSGKGPQELETCALTLLARLDRIDRWAALVETLSSRAAHQAAALEAQLVTLAKAELVKHLGEARGYACGVRLAVAVMKRCHQRSCSADEVAGYLREPHEHFAVDQRLPAALCWQDGKYAEAPARLVTLQRHVLDGLELLQPVRDAQGRARTVAAVRLAFQILGELAPEHREHLMQVEELAVALLEQRHDAALTATLRLVRTLARSSGRRVTLPPELDRLAQLVGAVASYASVYEATKDQDKEAAREARKRALESIIDAATDRSARGEKWVVSIGSNVGMSYTVSNLASLETIGPRWQNAYTDTREVQVRVPLGLAFQRLPRDGGVHHGWHLGLQIADLGQFVTTGGDGTLNEVEWSSFLSPGLEAGVLVGEPTRSINLTLHAAYAPGVSASGVFDIADDGSKRRVTREGVWRYGVSIGFYVPFFDLN